MGAVPRSRRGVGLVVVAAVVLLFVANLAAAQSPTKKPTKKKPSKPTKAMAVPKIKFGAGVEPHRANGERGLGQPEKCNIGYYKRYTGAYPCKQCAAGYIAPNKGAINCRKCASGTTSNAARSACVSAGGSAAKDVPKTTYGPGFEPQAVPGEDGLGPAVACKVGYYKAYSGAYPCKLCAEGTFAAKTASKSCTKCTPTALMTSNKARSKCVYKPGVPTPKPTKKVPTKKPTKKPTRSYAEYLNEQTKKGATVYRPAKPCRSEENGSQRCGIPVGFNDNGRTGTVFFPQGYRNRALPYMLLWHGSGWDGSDMINIFKQYAIEQNYVIVAPDSHNAMFWSSPDTSKDQWTADWFHAQGCWDAVLRMPGVKVDPSFISSFGNSRASYAATAFASRSPTNFNSAVIIHASALPQQMGTRVFPILWTTGTKDPLYGPGPTSIDVKNFRLKRPGYKISWQIWIDNHTINNYTQVFGMITWWLRPQTRNIPINTYG